MCFVSVRTVDPAEVGGPRQGRRASKGLPVLGCVFEREAGTGAVRVLGTVDPQLA